MSSHSNYAVDMKTEEDMVSKAKSVPPIKLGRGRMNWAADTYGTIGGPPSNLLNAVFARLMNKSYLYLVVFIMQCILVLVLVFWGPFAAIIMAAPNKAVVGASTALDALAVTFAAIFSVPSTYICSSPDAVILLTILYAVGKLSIASLTALLVMKISQVPNNFVVSDRAIVHRRNGKWTVSLRIGLLHKQVVRSVSIRMFCYAQVGNGVSILNLDAGPFARAGGFNMEGPEPINIRHVVDEASPMKELDWEDRTVLEKALSEGLDLHVHGFDSMTGRSCGVHAMFRWDDGTLVYAPEGSLADSATQMTPEHVALRKSNRGKKWGIDWRNFNGIVMRRGAKAT
jgi:hypothetical protein